MGKKQTQHKPFKLDDYNATTEPVENIVLPPSASSIPHGSVAYPGVYPYEPFPQPSPYPVLPPTQHQKHRGTPPGGVPSASQPVHQKRHKRSLIPGLVRFTFLLVQLVLLTRLCCLLFNIQDTTLWLALLFVASDVFIQPVRYLATTINLSILTGTQILLILEFVFAILAYGIFSRLLALFLRVLLNR